MVRRRLPKLRGNRPPVRLLRELLRSCRHRDWTARVVSYRQPTPHDHREAFGPTRKPTRKVDAAMMLSPDVTLIIKVTNACDMRCRYCFIEPSVFHKTMKDDTARRVVRAFLASALFQLPH